MVDNCYIWAMRDGINFTGDQDKTGIVIVGGHIRGSGTGVAGGVGLHLYDTNSLRVFGGSVASFETGVIIETNSYANEFHGLRIETVGTGINMSTNYNRFWGGALISAGTDIVDAGIYNVIHRMYDYLNERGGTATLANGTVAIVVPHGCDYTPRARDISVNPIETLNNASFWWVDTIGAVNFTINVDANPGQDVDFKWSVAQMWF